MIVTPRKKAALWAPSSTGWHIGGQDAARATTDFGDDAVLRVREECCSRASALARPARSVSASVSGSQGHFPSQERPQAHSLAIVDAVPAHEDPGLTQR